MQLSSVGQDCSNTQGQRAVADWMGRREQTVVLALNQTGVQISLCERLVKHQAAQKGHLGLHANAVNLAQCLYHPCAGLFAIVAPPDQFGEDRKSTRMNSSP